MGGEKIYSGVRTPRGCAVVISGVGARRVPLPPRRDLLDHSPGGFEWGYSGSGPAQLALALRLHQKFKFAVIAKLLRDCWQMTDGEVRTMAATL